MFFDDELLLKATASTKSSTWDYPHNSKPDKANKRLLHPALKWPGRLREGHTSEQFPAFA
jgi:hypothetical protein